MNVIFTDEQDDPLPAVDLADLARVALEAEGLPVSTELAITLVDEERMARLNTEYMGRHHPTDVLSFPIEDFESGDLGETDGGPPLLLGDVVICPSVVHANSERAGVAFGDEMALMVVHGILHLLGRDHVVDAEAERMEQREREILGMIGRTRP